MSKQYSMNILRISLKPERYHNHCTLCRCKKCRWLNNELLCVHGWLKQKCKYCRKHIYNN